MYPILFHLGPLTIYTVSIFHGLGCAAGVWLLFRRIEKTGWDKELVSGLVSVVIVWSVIGARLFSILFDGHLEWYLQNPEHIFMVWEGGFTFYGGFLFALAAGLWYARRKRMPIWRLSDMAAPALALGSAVGRLGCFASGDSFGKPTDLPWGVVYRDPHSLAPTGIALHPTQLYSVLTNLLLLGGVLLWRKRQRFAGELFLVYLLGYAATRFIVEIFRNDPRGVYLGGLISTSQIIGLVSAVTVLIIYQKKSRNYKDYNEKSLRTS